VLSDSCAAPVVSGIKKFRGEFEAYIQKSSGAQERRREGSPNSVGTAYA
jgi:hypothetical protein